LVHRPDIENRLVLIDGPDGVLYGGKDGRKRKGSAYDQAHGLIGTLEGGEIDGGAGALVEACVEDRAHDADDFARGSGGVGDLDVLSEGILVVEKTLGKGLINEHDPRTIEVVMFCENTAMDERNSHGVKKVGSDIPEVGGEVSTWRRRRLFLNDELGHVHVVLAKGNDLGERGGLNARNCLHGGKESLEDRRLATRFLVRRVLRVVGELDAQG
jgi:hypothetical protein